MRVARPCAVLTVLLASVCGGTDSPLARVAQAAAPPAAQATAAPLTPLKVRILIANQVCCDKTGGVSWMLGKAGIFKEEGLDVTWDAPLAGSPAALSAALAGQTDIVQLSVAAPIAAVAAGRRVVVIAGSTVGLWNGFAVSAAQGKKFAAAGLTPTSPLNDRIKAMKGLKIWVGSARGILELKYRQMFRDVGLDPVKDMVAQAGAQDAGAAAWRTGRVDTYPCCDPLTFSIVPDAVAWIRPGEVKSFLTGYVGVYIASENYAEANGEVIKRFVKGLERARLLLADAGPGGKSRDAVLSMLKAVNPAMPAKDLEASFDASRGHLLDPVAPLKRSLVQEAIDDYNASASQTVNIKPEDLVFTGSLVN